MTATDRDTLPEPVIERLRRERREPRPTQFDYLHLTVLRAHLRAAIEEAPRPILDALDVFCGVRPYDDLLPARTRIVGLDIDAHFGEPDVTGDTLGAFDDQSFDLVMCLEALHYAPDPAAAVADMLRVLRPGGTAIVAVPHIHEHNRDTPEWRFTGPQLTALFDGWADVVLRENGGRAVAWTHSPPISSARPSRRWRSASGAIAWRALRSARSTSPSTSRACNWIAPRATRRRGHSRSR